MASKGFGGYDIWTTINEKWEVEPESLSWNTETPVRPGAMGKLGFTIAVAENGGFELSYVLRRDGIFEPFDTVEAAMKRADALVETAKAGQLKP